MTVKKKPAKRARRNYSAQADRLCGALVRARGECEAEGEHTGPLQWAHGFSRSYRAVRWDLRNGFCLCSGHHFFFTNHPLEWDNWLHEKWGTVQYLRMRGLAVGGLKPDLPSLVESLKALTKEAA
jgi:hypothetical protein